MTTPSTRHPRRRRRPATLTTALPTAPAPVPPSRPDRGCCRTWSSEHRTSGGTVVRTTWHEPACRTWGRP
ncbi:hypothetical protein [Kitasatospora sp. NPDC093806]|uniref:hypothetical protein n=1 Tax=Kitasatospora sp. NPDC093806 TaxID=3155075 RepID=UPI003417B25B